MPQRKRNASGRYETKATPDDVLDVFDIVDGPVVTSSDVADALDVSGETARQRLADLEADGALGSRKTGRTRVYWIAGDGRARSGRRTGTTRAADGREPGESPAEVGRNPGAAPAAEEHDVSTDEIERAVELGSKSWDDSPAQLQARRDAARAVLEAVRETPMSKSELQDELFDAYPVDGQNEGTWWRRNIKSEAADHGGPIDYVAEYSNSSKKYEWRGLNEDGY